MNAFVTWKAGEIDGGPVKPPTKEGECFSPSKEVWGGKAAGLMEMCAKNLPVPPGFTISTEVCRAYQKSPAHVMAAIAEDIPELLAWLKDEFGYMPLLSVRSGAPVSMPGMMDTILNVGLTSKTLMTWYRKLGGRTVWDCRRRLIQMYGEVVFGVPKEDFQAVVKKALLNAKVAHEVELTETRMSGLAQRFDNLLSDYEKKVPDTLEEQVLGAIEAVFKSWMNPRAIEYRKIYGIDDAMGTACTVQAMAFGNAGEDCGTGVLFTRNPSTGAQGIVGEFLINAQGEDVVAGTHTPLSFSASFVNGSASITTSVSLDLVHTEVQDALLQLTHYAAQLEAEAGDMQDIEFTIEHGKLWVLQTRTGKRSAQAAFVIANDYVQAGQLTLEEAAKRLTGSQYAVAQRPSLDRAKTFAKLGQPAAKGLPASVGVSIGRAVSDQASFDALVGQPRILVREETTPDDIAMMAQSAGILTFKGGFTSHAAVVARGMDKPCVVACSMAHVSVSPGDWLTIDASTGEVWLGQGVVTDGVGALASQMVLQLAAQKGMMVRTEEPLSGAHIVAAGSMLRGEAAAWLDKVLAAPLSNAVLDLRTPDQWLETQDSDFLNYTGESEPFRRGEAASLGELIAKNAKGHLGCRVLLGEVEDLSVLAALEQAGFAVVPTVQSLAQALGKNGKQIMLGPRAREFAGSDEAFQQLCQWLAQGGVTLAELNSLTMGEAAAQLLG